MTRLLFVCLGNICRSPTVEAVARVEFARAGLGIEVDSAGTAGYHVGEPPDARSIAAGAAQGYDLLPLRARKIATIDFRRFDRVFAMDRDNLRALRALRPHDGVEPELFLGDGEVPDPYYGDASGFDRVVMLAREGVATLIAGLRAQERDVGAHRMADA